MAQLGLLIMVWLQLSRGADVLRSGLGICAYGSTWQYLIESREYILLWALWAVLEGIHYLRTVSVFLSRLNLNWTRRLKKKKEKKREKCVTLSVSVHPCTQACFTYLARNSSYFDSLGGTAVAVFRGTCVSRGELEKPCVILLQCTVNFLVTLEAQLLR